MEINYADLETCSQATGVAVVIDVLRAFTTACYAFDAGVDEILLSFDIATAMQMRRELPNSLVMGEDGGKPIVGFDYNNSPAQFVDLDLSGKHMIQRTSNGVQGVVRSSNAACRLTASFVCAGATARLLQMRQPDEVTFVITGWEDGEEDRACAEYIHALLLGEQPDAQEYLERVAKSWNGQRFLDSDVEFLPASDLPLVTALDRFDFAMEVKPYKGYLRMLPVYPKLT